MNITAAMVKDLRERTGAGMMECKKTLVETGGDIEEAVMVMRKRGKAKADKRASKTAAEGAIITKTTPDQQKALLLEVNCETDFVGRDQDFQAFVNQVASQGLIHDAHTIEALLAAPFEKASDKTVEDVRHAMVAKVGENIQLRRVSVIKNENGMVGSYNHGQRIGVIVAIDQNNPELAKDLAMHIAASKPLGIQPDEIPEEILAKEREVFVAQAKDTGKSDDIIEKMVKGRIAKFLKEVCLLNQPFVKNPEQTITQLLDIHKAHVIRFARFEVGEGIEKQTGDFASEVKAQVQGSD